MTPERYQQIRAVFVEASALTGSARSTFLSERCVDDEDLRREVESLLAHDTTQDEADAFAESKLGFGANLIQPEPNLPTHIGNYELLDPIGQGGMGIVFRARQESPRRTVAIKIMRNALGRSALRRFTAEAQTLAELRHPGIAEVYESGVYAHGSTPLPYFVMELIPGARTITEFVHQEQLRLKETLELFAQVCDAVQHGHQNGVIHRDLKPDNILVDEGGAPHIIDFGIARALRAGDDAHSITQTGNLVGTLAYMSPEQVDAQQVGTRADVYALGAVLYETLSKQAPVDLRGLSIPGACDAIRNVEPTRLGEREHRLRGDVEMIVDRALAKEQHQRYASAGELAADIRRHLADEPILARPPTLLYQFRKFTRRNRGLVFGTGLAAIGLLLGLIASILLAIFAFNARDAALRTTYQASIVAAAAALERHDVARARSSLALAPKHLRGWEWSHLRGRLDQAMYAIDTHQPLQGTTPWLTNRDQQDLLLLPHLKGKAQAWRADDRTALPVRPESGRYTQSVDGRYHADIRKGTLHLNQPTRTFDLAAHDIDAVSVTSLARSSNGRYVAMVAPNQTWRVDLDTNTVDYIAIDNRRTGVDALDVAPDGTVFLASALNGRPAVWRPGGELAPLPDNQAFARSVSIHPDGTSVAFGLQDTTIGLWQLPKLVRVATGRGHEHAVTGVCFRPDGTRLTSASLDRTIRHWDATNLAPRGTLHGHEGGVWNLSFSPDGRRLVSSSEDRTIRIWDATRPQGAAVLAGHDGFVYAAAFTSDGKQLATAGWDRTIRIWDVATRMLLGTLPVDSDIVTALTFDPMDRYLTWVGDGKFGSFDTVDNRTIQPPSDAPWPGDLTVRSIAVAPRVGAVILPWTEERGTIKVWMPDHNKIAPFQLKDVNNDRYVLTLRAPGAGDARQAGGDSGSYVRVVRTDNGKSVSLPDYSGPCVRHGRTLAARRADDLTRIDIWDLQAEQLLGTLIGHTDPVYAIAWSPDGRRIATAGRDSLRIWNSTTRKEIVQLHGHTSFIWALQFSPDGRTLVSCSGDRTIRLWDAPPSPK